MHKLTTVVILLTTVFTSMLCTEVNQTELKVTKENETGKAEDSKRIGLHTGVVTSSGWNYGGTSKTQVTSVGGQAGILRSDGSYNPMYNQASQGGATYQTGLNPPDSYGVVTSQISPGFVGGSARGGVYNAYQKNVYTFEVNAGAMQPVENSDDYLWHGFNLHPSNSTDAKSNKTNHK